MKAVFLAQLGAVRFSSQHLPWSTAIKNPRQKIWRVYQDSNPGLLIEKRERYLFGHFCTFLVVIE